MHNIFKIEENYIIINLIASVINNVDFYHSIESIILIKFFLNIFFKSENFF